MIEINYNNEDELYTLFKNNINLFVVIPEVNKLAITDIINEIDLFGNFGIAFFSSSKKLFNPLYIRLLVV